MPPLRSSTTTITDVFAPRAGHGRPGPPFGGQHCRRDDGETGLGTGWSAPSRCRRRCSARIRGGGGAPRGGASGVATGPSRRDHRPRSRPRAGRGSERAVLPSIRRSREAKPRWAGGHSVPCPGSRPGPEPSYFPSRSPVAHPANHLLQAAPSGSGSHGAPGPGPGLAALCQVLCRTCLPSGWPFSLHIHACTAGRLHDAVGFRSGDVSPSEVEGGGHRVGGCGGAEERPETE